jgi:acyl dehydratase
LSELLTDEVKAWVGREVSYTAPDELGRAAIRYFALAIGDENPLYHDDDFAKASGRPSVIAPPTLVCETGQYMTGSRDAIGHTWNLPVQGVRMIRGGNEYEFVRPVVPDDVITASWRIEDIKERTTSAGLPMLIVDSKASYTNQKGDLLAINLETLIYQKT